MFCFYPLQGAGKFCAGSPEVLYKGTKFRNDINYLSSSSEGSRENRTLRPVYTLIMPSLARSLLIVAAVEGLLLTPIHTDNISSPHVSKSRRTTPVPSRTASPSPLTCQSETIQVDYRTGVVRKLLKANEENRGKEREGGLEVHGIAGRPHPSLPGSKAL